MGIEAHSNGTASKKGVLAPKVRPNYRGEARCEYGEATRDVVADMVTLCANNGAAIMFGRTADGGAYSVVVLADNDKVKEYPTSVDQLQQLYMWLRDVYFGI